MPDLRKTRKDLKIVVAVLAGLDLLAAVLYFSPLIGSAETRRMEMNQLQSELTTKTRQVAPLKDLPKKVDLASKEIGDFYNKRLASENSQILTEIGVRDTTWWGRGLFLFFNAFRVPYTQIGMRYDFIHHEWHGPNIGETYDPGPPAPQPPTGPPPPPVR